MNGGLSFQRCHHHAGREAAARCPDCARFYCRECVTEHGNRMLCASCLKRQERRDAGGGGAGEGALLLLGALAGLGAAWGVFLLLGELLIQMPAASHGDAVWDAGGPWDGGVE